MSYLDGVLEMECQFCECGCTICYAKHITTIEAKLERAESALMRAGFVDHGAEHWKPPLGENLAPVYGQLAEAERERDEVTAQNSEYRNFVRLIADAEGTGCGTAEKILGILPAISLANLEARAIEEAIEFNKTTKYLRHMAMAIEICYVDDMLHMVESLRKFGKVQSNED